jgi:hypothetical protein
MRWSLAIPQEIRSEVAAVPRLTNESAVVFSRPPLTEESMGNHICYQIIYSDALAKRLQEMHRDVVEVDYDVTFRFDTPIFYHSTQTEGG